MKERLKLISRLLRTNAINDDEAAMLIEPIKEYIYWGGYRWYDSRPYVYYSNGNYTNLGDNTIGCTYGNIISGNQKEMTNTDILNILKLEEFKMD